VRVLLTGADGFIGSHLVAGLLEAGHEVVACSRAPARGAARAPQAQWLACDFNRDVAPEDWAPRLAGVDAAINCAGVLRASRGQDIERIHHLAPCALFEACRRAGVRRVIQVSALGAEPEAGTAYADSKRRGDECLKSLDLDWIVLQPSLVIAAGSYGGTSLLRALAAFPFVLPVPGRGDQMFQPIAMNDLVRTVLRLLEPDAPRRGVLKAVGPAPIQLRDLLRALRRWLGLGDAPPVSTPLGLIRLAGRFGDAAGWLSGRGAVNSTAIRQMLFGNTADAEAFAQAVGFAPRAFDHVLAANPAHVQDRWHARLHLLRPTLRTLLAAFWIASGAIALWSAEAARELLLRVGLGAWSDAALGATATLDLLLGGCLLLRICARPVMAAQLALTFAYLIAASLFLPQLWLDPLGPLVKTLPLIGATLVALAIEDER